MKRLPVIIVAVLALAWPALGAEPRSLSQIGRELVQEVKEAYEEAAPGERLSRTLEDALNEAYARLSEIGGWIEGQLAQKVTPARKKALEAARRAADRARELLLRARESLRRDAREETVEAVAELSAEIAALNARLASLGRE